MRPGSGSVMGTDPTPSHMTRIVIFPRINSVHRYKTQQIVPFWTEVPVSFTGPQASLKEAATEQTTFTMGSLSVSSHRGLVHWQGLLLAGK